MAINRSNPNQTTTNKQKRSTKIDAVLKLLRRDKGAAIAELQKATGWQPHSVRAALTRLRQRKIEIVRSKDKTGTTRYIAKSQ